MTVRSNQLRFVLYRYRGAGTERISCEAALSASGAKADEWCGYATRDNAIIECGYTTAVDCENSVGKRGVCFIDPNLALETRRTTPLTRRLDATPPLPRQNG